MKSFWYFAFLFRFFIAIIEQKAFYLSFFLLFNEVDGKKQNLFTQFEGTEGKLIFLDLMKIEILKDFLISNFRLALHTRQSFNFNLFSSLTKQRQRPKKEKREREKETR